MKGLIKSSIIVASFTLAGQILGYLRELLIAYRFGATMESDSYFISQTVTGIYQTLIVAIIATNFIPLVTEVFVKNRGEFIVRKISNLINILVIITILITITAWITLPYITEFIIGETGTESYELVIKISKISLISVFMTGIVTIGRNLLQSKKLFLESATADIIINIFPIIFLSILFIDNIVILTTTVVIATIVQFILQLIALKKSKFKYKFNLSLKDDLAIKFYKMLPMIIGILAMTNATGIIEKKVLAGFIVGSVTIFYFARKIQYIFINLFVLSFNTVSYPYLSEMNANDDSENVNKMLSAVWNWFSLILIPISMGIYVYSEPLSQILFGRGEFSSEDVILTANIVKILAIGILPNALCMYYKNLFYSMHDLKSPFTNTIVMTIGYILCVLIGSEIFGVNGVAWACNISIVMSLICYLVTLARKNRFSILRENIIAMIKAILGSCIIIILYKVYLEFITNTYTDIILLICVVTLTIILYLVLMLLIKTKEVVYIKNKVYAKLKKT